MLPDLRDAKWQPRGLQQVPGGLHAGVTADAFVWALTEDQGYGQVHANYTFYVSRVGPQPDGRHAGTLLGRCP